MSDRFVPCPEFASYVRLLIDTAGDDSASTDDLPECECAMCAWIKELGAE